METINMVDNDKSYRGIWLSMSLWQRVVLIVNWIFTILQFVALMYHTGEVLIVSKWLSDERNTFVTWLSFVGGFIALIFATILLHGMIKKSTKLLTTYIVFGIIVDFVAGLKVLYTFISFNFILLVEVAVLVLYSVMLWLLGRTSLFFTAYNQRGSTNEKGNQLVA